MNRYTYPSFHRPIRYATQFMIGDRVVNIMTEQKGVVERVIPFYPGGFLGTKEDVYHVNWDGVAPVVHYYYHSQLRYE